MRTVSGRAGLPSTLLGLGLQLRADADAARRRHVATLAGRLGYASAWFPVSPGAPGSPGLVDEIDALAATGVIQVGAVLTGPPEAVLDWAGAVAVMRRELLVDVSGEVAADCAAVLGPDEWRRRGYVRATGDSAAAGTGVPAGPALPAGIVFSASSRAEITARVAAAARADVSHRLHVGVAVGVSIGRTMSEAQARVARDPFLAASGVADAGLFGPFEQVQEQVLALAAAGVDWLRADLADEHDIADLLAQLRAATVGPALVLHERER
jgi:hypothetical protein